MAWIMLATPSFASIEQVDAVLAQLDGAPDGMEERYIRSADDGELRGVSLWQSKALTTGSSPKSSGPRLPSARPRVGRCVRASGSTSSARTSQPVAGDATPAEREDQMAAADVHVRRGRLERP